MSLKDIELQPSYETTESKDQLLENFYIPVLQEANKYYRIAGFFSSSALVVASKGIEGLIHNGGKMYLLISPELSEEDFDTIKAHGVISAENHIFDDLKLDTEIPSENIQALAWLLDTGKLEIKIVVGKRTRNSLFHQKIGVVFDSAGNTISYSGSINETAQAWLNNIEEFKVFRSWEPGQVDYLQSDLRKFLAYWKNERPDIAEVYDVPEAIKAHIVAQKPRDVFDLNIMRRYAKDKKIKENKLSLFPHQENAVAQWIANDYSLLMEMATGTGKTRTAIGCIVEKLKDKEKLLIIVATPQNTLSRQWKGDFEKLQIALDKTLIVDGSNSKWKKELEILLMDISDNKYRTAIIFTTHATASDSKFINIIRNNKFDTKVLFICDETHAIGSQKQQKALLDEYEYRIGLSATPERMFDGHGTSVIRNYFGNKSFEFTIADALNTINPLTGRPFLNRFKYYPIFVELSDKEAEKYSKISRQIYILKNKEEPDEEELQRLYDRRANIGKNAMNKMPALEDLFERMNPQTIKDTILFVSDKQIESSFAIMSKKGIKRSKITEAESASKVVNIAGDTERQNIISQFVKQQLQVLVGIKCLDEGIDIPNARIAILLSNSTNPREYVQRVGRVIRQAPNKQVSIIYDFIVTPVGGNADGSGILEKEARRADQIAQNAENYEDVKMKFLQRGVQIDADK